MDKKKKKNVQKWIAQPGAIEREFGIPIAGIIQEKDKWTQTALKSYPSEGKLNWLELFGRAAPVVLDLGCGNGRSTLASAWSRPECDHLGIDTLPVVIRYARRRGNQRGLKNLKFAVGGAYELLDQWVEPGSVAEIHCYHPQPYYDPREVHKRLITPAFLTLVHRALQPDGQFVIQTDHPGYWQYIREIMGYFFQWEERIGPWPDSPKGRTRREIIAIRKGLPVFRGIGAPIRELTEENSIRLAGLLPDPVFEADRRLIELDHQERM
ncbi:MAG: methyltransferase domain-containing protein [Zavarzinella sp.]